MSDGPAPSKYTQSALAADNLRAKRRRRRIGAVVGAVVVAVCASSWLLWPESGQEPVSDRPKAVGQAPDEIRETVERVPTSPEGEVVVRHDEEDLEKNENDPRYAPGMWATDKILAKGVANRIKGFGIGASDDTAWTLDLGGHICATTRHVTADNRTAVVVQPRKSKGTKAEGVCDEVLFVDLDTGKELWRAKMPESGSAFVTDTNLTMTRGVVAVAWGQGSVAYDMDDGKQLWKSTGVSACEDTGFAGGRSLLALLRCGDVADHSYRVEKLDPRTGKVKWTYKLADGLANVYLPSSSPPVIAVSAGDSEVTDLLTLDNQGKYRATISMRGGNYDPQCGEEYYFGLVDKCYGMVVGRDRLYVTSKDQLDPRQEANWIMAFDLRTGKTVRKIDGRPGQRIQPIKLSGDQLLMYRESADGVIEPAAVVSVDTRTGKEKPFLLFSTAFDDTYDLTDPEDADILVEHGRVFFGLREVYADTRYPEDPVRTVLGIGARKKP